MKETIKKLSLDLNQRLMLCFYDLGRRISQSRQTLEHDSEFYRTLSEELLEKMGENGTFTVQNLKDLETFYNLYQNYFSEFPFDYKKAMSGEFIPLSLYEIICLPWAFHKMIIYKCDDVHEAFFYVEETYFCKWDEHELTYHLQNNSFEDPNYKVDTTSRSFFGLLQGEK